MRGPVVGPRVESVRVRFASCCGGETSIQPHHGAAFSKRCAVVRLSRCFAAAAVRKSRACAFHARAGFRSARGARERA
eukprot:3427705-Lingulodinium_polyedra.AAC.1